MIRARLIPAALTIITGYTAPAYCQPTFVADGASRASFYSGGVVYGTNRDEDNDYGVWSLDAPLYLSIYEPQVGYVLRMNGGRVVAAECTWYSVPPGASCVWDDEPGSVWMTANLAATFNADTMTWWRASASGLPTLMRGTNAPRLIGGEWVIPLVRRVDQSDLWWHWLGRPEPWYNHPEWFAPLPVWIAAPNTDTATLRVTLADTHADFTLTIHAEPPLHADVDRNGAVGATDLFTFLAAWFAADPVGDWDADGGCSTPDVFAFLSDWQAEAP